MSAEPDASAALIHDGEGEGSSTLRRFKMLECLASFYGPRSDAYAEGFQDGLAVPQNREAMLFQGLGLIDVGTIRRVPDLVNTVGRRRCDLPFRLMHRIERTYPIRNVLGADGIFHLGGSRTEDEGAREVPFHVDADTPHP